MAEKKTFRDSLLRTVALLGLLLVLLLGAWGIILLALNLPTIASGIGYNITTIFTGNTGSSSQNESLAVTAPQSATSGQAFSISWQHVNGDGEHAYTVAYSCQSGLSVKAPTASGQYQTVSCNTPFNYTNAKDKMNVIATVTGSASVPVFFTVSALKLDDGTITSSANATVNVARAVTTGSTSTGTTGGAQGTYVPAVQQYTTLYGYADLAVRMISINPASPSLGGSLSSYQGRIAVQFEIVNLGTNVAQSGWAFDAVLPLTPAYTYHAAAQQALYPGDKIVYTLTYDRPYTNNQVCTLQYPNYNCPQPYQTYPYQNQYQAPQTCYSYNGYQNITIPCVDADGYPIYTNGSTNYNQNYNYPYNGGYQGGIVTVTADPRGLVYDLNRANNTASINAPIY